jgi:diguanylate cyclase (GGDEF)-like protein
MPNKNLQLGSVNFLLSKLSTLTSQREELGLESSLAQILFDLIAQNEADPPKKVLIYRALDLKQQLFSAVSIDQKQSASDMSAALKQALSASFTSGNYANFVQSDRLSTQLYPLKNLAGQVIAIIAIDSQQVQTQLHEAAIMLLQIYQNISALIHDNQHDALTGLLSRKSFEFKMNKVLAQLHLASKRKHDKQNPLYFLAIFDIDYFKNVNDAYGHLIGDEVLLMFSQLMSQTFRDNDLLFRFGGEEFIGVFECANAEDTQLLLDRFRNKVDNFYFPPVGNVTVSAGYTQISADDSSSQIIDRADLALYYAKNHGRNCIFYYEQLIVNGVLLTSKKEGDIELF